MSEPSSSQAHGAKDARVWLVNFLAGKGGSAPVDDVMKWAKTSGINIPELLSVREEVATVKPGFGKVQWLLISQEDQA